MSGQSPKHAAEEATSEMMAILVKCDDAEESRRANTLPNCNANNMNAMSWVCISNEQQYAGESVIAVPILQYHAWWVEPSISICEAPKAAVEAAE